MTAGVRAHHLESVVDAGRCRLGQNTLGLLDQDPAVEGALELVGHDSAFLDQPFLEDSDRRDVRKRLRREYVPRVQFTDAGVEKIESSDGLPAEPEWRRVDRMKALLQGFGPKIRPP